MNMIHILERLTNENLAGRIQALERLTIDNIKKLEGLITEKV